MCPKIGISGGISGGDRGRAPPPGDGDFAGAFSGIRIRGPEDRGEDREEWRGVRSLTAPAARAAPEMSERLSEGEDATSARIAIWSTPYAR